MKFLDLINLILFVLFLASGCVPGFATAAPTTSPLPDLVVSNMYLGMQGVALNSIGCIPAYSPLEIRATIQNTGRATANNITIAELSSSTNLKIEELGVGQGIEVSFPISASSSAYEVVIDPQNTISESDEGNNSRTYFAITPTPPVLCTPASALPSLNNLAKENSNRGLFS